MLNSRHSRIVKAADVGCFAQSVQDEGQVLLGDGEGGGRDEPADSGHQGFRSRIPEMS